jgi:hypothetical protein
MHFAGLHRTPEIICSTYLENGVMIFRLALHLPTENTDDVTGQSFTIGGQLDERNLWPSLFRQPGNAMRSPALSPDNGSGRLIESANISIHRYLPRPSWFTRTEQNLL